MKMNSLEERFSHKAFQHISHFASSNREIQKIQINSNQMFKPSNEYFTQNLKPHSQKPSPSLQRKSVPRNHTRRDLPKTRESSHHSSRPSSTHLKMHSFSGIRSTII